MLNYQRVPAKISMAIKKEPIDWRYLPDANYQQNMAKNDGTFTYLHFRILKFPLKDRKNLEN